MAESFVANDDCNIEYLVEYALSEDRFILVVWVKNSCDGMQIHVVIVGREW
jgi:hypothetical protein